MAIAHPWSIYHGSPIGRRQYLQKVFSASSNLARGTHEKSCLKRRIKMAGIKEALIRVAEGNNYGYCIHKGIFSDKRELITRGISKFMIIRLERGSEILTVFDYGSDIRIADGIEDGDLVKLNILDNSCAEWARSV